MTLRTFLAVVLALSAAAGCYTNSHTPFPEGLEPWEETNLAPLPAPVGSDPCPEQITFVRGGWMGSRSVHARACIHAPIAEVWRAVRDPQTGRDPTTTHGFRVLAYDTEPEYDYSYQTYVFVDHPLTDIEFQLHWRHGIVEGEEPSPRLTATRWQKTWGSDAIRVLEGSLILRPLESDPTITVQEYQYHLSSVGSGYDTIEAYLMQIWSRLRDRAHGRMLPPGDCIECATPPERYR